jgi:hypothetical protein
MLDELSKAFLECAEINTLVIPDFLIGLIRFALCLRESLYNPPSLASPQRVGWVEIARVKAFRTHFLPLMRFLQGIMRVILRLWGQMAALSV